MRFTARTLCRGCSIALVGMAFLATACGGPSGQPAASTPPVASAPTATVQAPTAAASPVAAKPAGTATVAPASVPAAASSPSSAGSVRLVVVPAESEGRFVARELLAANTVQNDAVGKTREITGQLIVGENARFLEESKITVNLQSLKSDRDQRDNYIKRNTLQTSQFPNAEFVAAEAQGLAWPLPTSGEATFKLRGDLTVRGVTKPATWDVVGTFTPLEVSGKATTVVRLDTFGMQTPRVPLVASIEDDIRLEIDFKATRG